MDIKIILIPLQEEPRLNLSMWPLTSPQATLHR